MSGKATTCDICSRPMDKPSEGVVTTGGVLEICDSPACVMIARRRPDLIEHAYDRVLRNGPPADGVPLATKIHEIADTLPTHAQRLLLCTIGITHNDDEALSAALRMSPAELADARREIARGVDAWNEANKIAKGLFPR